MSARTLASTGIAALLLAAAPPGDLRPIPLHAGVNRVHGFLPDGGTATIVQAWRANGYAHGHHDWLVLRAAPDGDAAEEVTLVNPETHALEDVIADAPFDGERVLGSVRFARGRVDGRAASLVLQAVLNASPSGVLADHATAAIRVFRLEQTGGAPGDSPLEFRPIFKRTTAKRYCNADLALSQTLSVPLPADHAAPNRSDGCFAS